jgi:arabinogalactan endo-1,4-beta-galactosidase
MGKFRTHLSIDVHGKHENLISARISADITLGQEESTMVGKSIGALAALPLLLGACNILHAQESYVVGADVSFLGQAESQGVVFKDDHVGKPGLEIFKDHGYNWVRLRIFNAPTTLPNNLSYTITLAQQAKKYGFKLLLDFHYSDTWADPGKQFTPNAWTGMTHPQLVEAVFSYTQSTIASFRDAGVLPDMVQIGNEITHGMIWPDGKLPDNWDNFAQLIEAGINGVDAGRGNGPRPKIMIHIDRGGDVKRTKEFFDKLLSYGISFDVIGQSYYPWWQGSLNDLHDNLVFMANRYHKDIIVVETAYDWKPGNYKSHPGPFPETPEGQKEFLSSVNQVVMETPGGYGKGLFWWEPAVTGSLVIRGFFDDSDNALPVMTVFDPYTRH